MKPIAEKINTQNPRALIIDDDELFRSSLKRILNVHGYATSIYESLAELVNQKDLPQVGCAILDLNLPDSNGLEIQERLAKAAPALAIIFVTGFGAVSSSVRAMKAGAVDFLEKPVEEADLLQAVERAIDYSQRFDEDRRELQQLRFRYETLSMRERVVFSLVTSGLLNKQAAAEIGVKEKTVKVHRAQVMAKMKATSFAELVRIAQRLGLAPNETAINRYS
jgi:FixJ family two-component response regulator